MKTTKPTNSKFSDTKPPIDLSQLDATTVQVLDVYRRTTGIYERATAAMGRVQRYRVTMSNTNATAILVGDRDAAS